MAESFSQSHIGRGQTHQRRRLEMHLIVGGISASSEGKVKVPQAVLPVIIDLEGAFAHDRGVLEESWPRLMSVLKEKIVEPIFRERLIAERESKRVVDIGASRSGNNSKRKVVAPPLRLYGVERKAEGGGIVLVYVVRKTSPHLGILTWMAGEREVRRVRSHCFFVVCN